MMTHHELVEKMLSNPKVKAEYDALSDEFALFMGTKKDCVIMSSPSNLEKIASNTVLLGLASTIAAVSFPIAAFIPVLLNSLATGRFQERIKNEIEEIKELVEYSLSNVNYISDNQFKAINETILAVIQTVDSDKVIYLKNILRNILSGKVDLERYEIDVIYRILRDISSEELKYFLDIYHFEEVIISLEDNEASEKNNKLSISRKDSKIMLVTGLTQLGIFRPPISGWGGSINYLFSPICEKLIFVCASFKQEGEEEFDAPLKQ